MIRSLYLLTLLAAPVLAEEPSPTPPEAKDGPEKAEAQPATPAKPEPAKPEAAAPDTAKPEPAKGDAAPERPLVIPREPIFERRTTWDLGLEGALGTTLPTGTLLGLGRVRAGVLWIRNSWYLSVGGIVELNNVTPRLLGLGVQGEVMHIESGLWLQAGALVDLGPRAGVVASVGWSLFGAELQVRDLGGAGAPVLAFYGKLRLPIRIILKALGV